jgi:uncharacterized protein
MQTAYEQKSAIRPAGFSKSRKVQFVVATSKHCNLRCRYCYEFPDLADKTTMSGAQLRTMYQSIADHYHQVEGHVALEFDWHGGEPLLLGPDFYWRTFDDQTKIFTDPKITVRNCVQTNLTVLDEDLIRLLNEGFEGVGVSIDLFSGLRVNVGGRDLQPTVLKNIDRLREARVPFGCITVLSRKNLKSLPNIYRFFAEAGISPRILPVHRGATDTQNDADLLTEEEVLQAYIDLFEMWIDSSAPIAVEPICSYTERVIWSLSTRETSHYDKSDWEFIYIVNTDGNLYSYADIFNISMSHGNLFEEPMSVLVNGARHQDVIRAAQLRMDASCFECRHYGRACSGYPIAEESPSRRDPRPGGEPGAACTRERGILDHIERRLFELGIVGPNGKIDVNSKLYPHFDPAMRLPL